MSKEWALEDVRRLFHQEPNIRDVDVVNALAARYDVSPRAIEFLLANLGLWPPL